MTEFNIIRYFHGDQEYVTRAQIIAYFNIPSSNLDRLLARRHFTKVEDCAKFYYKKCEVEQVLGVHASR